MDVKLLCVFLAIGLCTAADWSRERRYEAADERDEEDDMMPPLDDVHLGEDDMDDPAVQDGFGEIDPPEENETDKRDDEDDDDVDDDEDDIDDDDEDVGDNSSIDVDDDERDITDHLVEDTRGVFPDCKKLDEPCGHLGFSRCCGDTQCYHKNGLGVGKSGVCVRCVENSLTCQYHTNCCNGSFCSKPAFGPNGHCAKKSGNGVQCVKSYSCLSGHCKGGKCSPGLKEGESCSWDTHCLSGKCRGWKCVLNKAEDGATCFKNTHCLSKYCHLASCTKTMSDGSSCRSSASCTSGYCKNSVWKFLTGNGKCTPR